MTTMSVAGARPAARPAVRPALRPAARPALRLTRRGRLAVLGALLVLLVIGLSVGQQSSQAADRVVHTPPAMVTVQSGESLWQLASRVAPHADPRLVITEIERLNALSGPVVYAGQSLQVPRYR